LELIKIIEKLCKDIKDVYKQLKTIEETITKTENNLEASYVTYNLRSTKQLVKVALVIVDKASNIIEDLKTTYEQLNRDL